MDNQMVSFNLNPKFYSKDAVLGTIISFNDVCSGEFDETTFNIKLVPKEECDQNALVYEFCNYCLSLMR